MIDYSTTNWIIFLILIHAGWWFWSKYKIWKEFDSFRSQLSELATKEKQMDVIGYMESRIKSLESEMQNQILLSRKSLESEMQNQILLSREEWENSEHHSKKQLIAEMVHDILSNGAGSKFRELHKKIESLQDIISELHKEIKTLKEK